MTRKIMIVQWAGPLPDWIDKWHANTTWVSGSGHGWAFLLDNDEDSIRGRIERLGVACPELSGRKLCDYRPALGEMYADEVAGYDFWGHTDLDCVYGPLWDYVTDDLLDGCDVFSNDWPPFMCGPFSLYRTASASSVFRLHDGWQSIFEDPNHVAFDERPIGRTIARTELRTVHRHWHGSNSMYVHFRDPKTYPDLPAAFFDDRPGSVIDCLVFSRDRPLQLDGLLASMTDYAPRLFSTVTVLYHASSPAFEDAYRNCSDDHPDVAFQAQGDSFENDVRGWLARPGEHVCFLVDDDLFVRRAPEPVDATPRAREGGADVCFALRLEDDRGWWDWRDENDGRGYPLALDGHIYRRRTIADLLNFAFVDPRSLEGGLAGQRGLLAESYIAAADRQSLVGIAANRVATRSTCFYDPRGDDEWSAASLLAAYLDGYRLDRAAMEPELDEATGTHPKITLAFYQLQQEEAAA